MSRSGEKSESSWWDHRFIVTFRLVAALDAHVMRINLPCTDARHETRRPDVELRDTDLDRHNRTDECGWIIATGMRSEDDMAIMGWRQILRCNC